MPLRIALVGQAAFGEKTLERLGKRHEIVGVWTRPDPPSGKPDPLRARGEEMGVPVFQPKSMKTDEVFEAFRDQRADLAVLAYVTVIVPERVIELPRLGTLCFHPSLLPRYRGGSAINWQIIRGERRSGLTVFWTDAGIDTGPILLQKEAGIGPDDTAGSFYFEKIFPLGIDAIEEAVDLVEAGNAPRIVQDESQATYDPLCRDEHVGIDWSLAPEKLYALVRGADPQPGAWALRSGEKIRLYDTRLERSASGAAGTILAIDEEGVRIGLGEAVLRVGRLRLGDSPKKAAPAELAREGKLAVGERLEAAR